MFGRKGPVQAEAEFIKRLLNSERAKPNHKRPRSLQDGHFASFSTPAHEVMFEDFDWFGPVMNQRSSDPWMIEEQLDTHVRVRGADMPHIGRTYKVYYNAEEVGSLQVTLGVGDELSVDRDRDWCRAHRAALVILELEYLRFIPWDDAHQFVSALEQLIGTFPDQKGSEEQATARATRALTGYLWDSLRVQDYVPDFYLEINGPYELLVVTTEHWKEGGIDPFLKWDGDRSWSPRSD